MKFYFNLAIFGIVYPLPFLANCTHLPTPKKERNWQSLLLPQFMIRIGHGQAATVEAEQMPVDTEESAEIVHNANEFIRPSCYFSPVQCLLRSPGQHRSFETHQQMISSDQLLLSVAGDANPFKLMVANGDDSSSSSSSSTGENVNLRRQRQTKQRTERQIGQPKDSKPKQDELWMNRRKIGQQQETMGTFRQQLFRNLWRN